jgi:alpha-beta hydrolase superfamily lysophospholipase
MNWLTRKMTALSILPNVLLICLSLSILLPSRSFANPLNPIALDACHGQIKPAIVKQLSELNERYKKVPGGDPIWPGRESILLGGTNGRAVLMIGGFIASPRDFLDLAIPLQKAGFTVYIPLIAGFGGGYHVANASTPDEWKGSVLQAMDTLSSCFSDISIVAHSLGGAIVSDLLLLHRDIVDSHLHGAQISSLSLLAPYYKPYYLGLEAAQELIEEHTDKIDLRVVRALLTLAGDTGIALPIPPGEREDDDPYFPIVAGRTVLSYQQVFSSDLMAHAKSSISSYIVYSADDHVVDGGYSIDFAQSHFNLLNNSFYSTGQGVSHYLHHPEENPHFPQMRDELLKFIGQH